MLADQGLTTRQSSKWAERPLSRSQLALILRDPYYIGMVTFKGAVYPGRHEALISTELYEQVQKVMDARLKRGQRDRVHTHFLRGMLQCGLCESSGREHRLIFSQAKNARGELYDYYLCRGRQDGECSLPYIPVRDIEEAVARRFALLAMSPKTLEDARTNVVAALDQVLARQKDEAARLKKEAKKLAAQEDRLVDLASDGALPTEKLRERLRELGIRKHQVQSQLERTDDHLRARAESVLVYLDLMGRPDSLFRSVTDAQRRQLLSAFFKNIWISDDGHDVTASTALQPVVEEVRGALVGTPTNAKGAGEISDAFAAKQVNLYLKVICSSKTNLVAGAGLEPATSRL